MLRGLVPLLFLGVIMSLDTYENLKQEIIDWSHRKDIDLKVDTFIDLAESEMYANRIEPLQVKGEDTLVTDTLDSVTPSRFLALPAGYQSLRKLSIQIANGENVPLEFESPSQLNIQSVVSMPRFFTVTSQFEFDRTPDQDYTVQIQYFKRFTPLSDSNTTNTILTNHPTIYLYGSLWAEKVYANEEEEAALHYDRFIGAIRGANQEANIRRYGNNPVQKIDGPTP
jgi:hypothetical protein